MGNVVNNFEDFKQVYETKSQQVSQFMDRIFITNAQTESVNRFKWDVSDNMLVFGDNSSCLSADEIQKKFKDSQVKTNNSDGSKTQYHLMWLRLKDWMFGGSRVTKYVTVEVRIVSVAWYTMMSEFFPFMAEQSDI